MGWIVFAAVVIPLVGVIAWLLLDDSIVRIEPGQQGLMLLKGQPTKKAVGPGVHWVPAMRRRTIETYPSVELSLRLGDNIPPASGDLEWVGPAARICLADRTRGAVSSTLRFRIDISALQTVHTRFGVEGYWSAVRDISESTVSRVLTTTEVDALYGASRADLDARLAEALTADLGAVGFSVTSFNLFEVDLGQTSAVMEATARARHELAREQAEAGMRLVRSQIDAELAPYARAGSEVALRYREVDSLREIARASNVVVPVSSRPVPDPPPVEPEAQPAAEEQA